MASRLKVHSAAGWMAGAQGAEFPFIWLSVFVFILLRGGGPYSVDRKLDGRSDPERGAG